MLKPCSDRNSMRTSPALSRKAVFRIWLLKSISPQPAIIFFSNIAAPCSGQEVGQR
ncbi:hypothetical protein D3C86_2173140 [compost metagenome]